MRTAPNNFVTNPPKKGNPATCPGVLLQKEYYDHIKDPYDARKELLKKEREEHHRKMQEKPFNGTVHGNKTFANVLEVYGEDRDYPARKPKPEPPRPEVHEHAFKPANPAKKGWNKTFNTFPEHMPDPMRVVTRKQKVEGEEEKPRWKPTHNNNLGAPMKSVTTHMKNLRSEFPSVFKKF